VIKDVNVSVSSAALENEYEEHAHVYENKNLALLPELQRYVWPIKAPRAYKRHLADHEVAAFVLAMSSQTSAIFHKTLSGTVATLANVAIQPKNEVSHALVRAILKTENNDYFGL